MDKSISEMLHCFDLKDEVEPIKYGIMTDAIKTRHEQDHNFVVHSNYTNYLYELFLRCSRQVLNPFTLRDTNFKLWCLWLDYSYPIAKRYHNHSETTTINAVIYLKVGEGQGIEFKNKGEYYYYEPKDFEMIIFPNFLDHRPKPYCISSRISLNLEIRCNESSEVIFK